jgi:hypothetical protein
MKTYQLIQEVLGYNQSRANSCYMVIEGVLLRIADHQANNDNFEAYNEDFKAILNVVITDDFMSEKSFNEFLDSKEIQGEFLTVGTNEDLKETAETIKYYLNRLK